MEWLVRLGIALVAGLTGFLIHAFFEEKIKFRQAKRSRDSAQERISQIGRELREIREYRSDDQKFLLLLAEQNRSNDRLGLIRASLSLIAFPAIVLAISLNTPPAGEPTSTYLFTFFIAILFVLMINFISSFTKIRGNLETNLRNILNLEVYEAKLNREKKDLEEEIEWMSRP